LPSLEWTVSWIARNAGAVMIGGFSLPPSRISNVAGTRAFVEPPLLFVPPLPFEPPLAEAPPEDAEPEPPEPEPPLGDAPPLLPVVDPVVVVPDPDGDVLVDAGAVVLLWTVEVTAPVSGVVEVEPAAAALDELSLLLELEEPPQPPMINKSGSSAESAKRRLTFSG
jgi:hypothetical protein